MLIDIRFFSSLAIIALIVLSIKSKYYNNITNISDWTFSNGILQSSKIVYFIIVLSIHFPLFLFHWQMQEYKLLAIVLVNFIAMQLLIKFEHTMLYDEEDFKRKDIQEKYDSDTRFHSWLTTAILASVSFYIYYNKSKTIFNKFITTVITISGFVVYLPIPHKLRLNIFAMFEYVIFGFFTIYLLRLSTNHA